MNPVARYCIVTTARSYLGTPYIHIGRLKGIGVDCIGLVWCVAMDLKIHNGHDLTNYARSPDGVTLQREFGKVLDVIPVEEAIPGDVLIFRIGKAQLVTHAGIKTPIGVIHTHMGIGRVVEHNLDERWTRRIAGAYRYRGVEETYHEPDLTGIPEYFKEPASKSCCGS